MVFVLSASSFGDIVLIIALASKIYTTLSHYDESDELNALRGFLQSYILTLEFFDKLLGPLERSLPDDVVRAIRESLNTCKVLTDDFAKRIASHSRKSSPHALGRLGSWVYSRLISPFLWQSTKEDMVHLHEKLHSQLQFISVVLTVVLRQNQSDFEGISASEHVMLVDMLDERLEVPLHACVSAEVFHGFLRARFRARAGRALIERGDYTVVLRTRDSQVRELEWGILPEDGAELDMRALMRVTDEAVRRCPRCKKIVRELLTGDTTCSYCRTSLHIINQSSLSLSTTGWICRSLGLVSPIYFRVQNDGGADPQVVDPDTEWQYIRRLTLALPAQSVGPNLAVLNTPVDGPQSTSEDNTQSQGA
ncbi:unnamed protein product [Somion occarium]|uniref:Ubiquitin-like domain-containing protein n=1 Tax=Somion occarium TaxID=3059160 RepID=A0ABP1DT03_9APHY